MTTTTSRILFSGIMAYLCLGSPLSADYTEAEDEVCSQELFVAFFPPAFVSETLTTFQIPQEKHEAIIRELADQELDVIPLVEMKAAAMNPNPLNQPDQQDIVIGLFEEVVVDVFTNVLTDNGVSDQQVIHEMLEDIHRQKAERFRQCMNQSFGE